MNLTKLDPATLRWAAERISHPDHVTIADNELPGYLVTEIVNNYPRTFALLLNAWANEVEIAKGKPLTEALTSAQL